jgi:hypothetical protein
MAQTLVVDVWREVSCNYNYNYNNDSLMNGRVKLYTQCQFSTPNGDIPGNEPKFLQSELTINCLDYGREHNNSAVCMCHLEHHYNRTIVLSIPTVLSVSGF